MPCGKTLNMSKLIKLSENLLLVLIWTRRKLRLLQRPRIKMGILYMTGNQIKRKEKSSILRDRLLLIQLRQRSNHGKLLIQLSKFHMLRLLLLQLLLLPRQHRFLLCQQLHQLLLLLLLLQLLSKKLLVKPPKLQMIKSLPNGKTSSSKETLLSKLSTSSSSSSQPLSDFCTLISKLTKKRK